MASGGITAEQFQTWLTPAEAVAKLASAFQTDDQVARVTLLHALRSKVAIALAEKSSWDNGARQRALAEIPADEWDEIDSYDLFWTTGHMAYETRDETYYGGTKYVPLHRFGVRLEPSRVKSLLPPEPLQDQSSPEVERTESERPKGPPVSDADLKAWYELYGRVYGGTKEDTEATAVKSAQGMFPTKSVSRDRVRDLRGEQKRGPKGPRNSST